MRLRLALFDEMRKVRARRTGLGAGGLPEKFAMASTFNAIVCAFAAIVLWTCIGFPIARRVLPGPLALPMAASLGWAVHSAAMLPVFSLIGMSRLPVLAVTATCLLAAVAAIVMGRHESDRNANVAGVPVWAIAGAALLACGPAAGILPKISGDSIALAAPIFDHSKIALIDEMARLGVPAGNPFFGEAGSPVRVAYYYLWHFSAAELALLMNLRGWEADAGLTWFTAFASLSLMMGLATWFAGRAAAAYWALLLAATASLRPFLTLLLGAENAYALIGWSTGFGGWLFQSGWAPQHFAGAMCCVLAILLMAQLARRRSVAVILVLALVVAAGFQSSAWVGGIVFPAAAAAAGLTLLARIEPDRCVAVASAMVVAAVLAAGLAAPFLYDEAVATALRGGGSPIAFRSYYVLGSAFPDGIRRVLDLPAYWLVFLVIEFPAIYPAGVTAMVGFLRERGQAADRMLIGTALAALVAVSFVATWLLASTIGDNNDLGWRAVLPGVMILTAFAAAGLSRWISFGTPVMAAAVAASLAAGLFESVQIINGNLVFAPAPTARTFATTPEMWAAVRRHAFASDRIANNPLFLEDVTPWPVNISWALLANRRSCYAGKELALPFAPISKERRDEIDAQFVRVFAGKPADGDIDQLAGRYSLPRRRRHGAGRRLDQRSVRVTRPLSSGGNQARCLAHLSGRWRSANRRRQPDSLKSR